MSERFTGSICLANKCSACCIDSQMRLTRSEYEFMKEGGTQLMKKYVPAGLWDMSNYFAEPDDGKTTYDMNGSCGYLKEGLCVVYNDPRRPGTCAVTDPGGTGCKSCRAQHGLQPIVLYNF